MLDTKRLLDQFLGAGNAPVQPKAGRQDDLQSLVQGALGGRGLQGLLGGLGGSGSSTGTGGGGLGSMLGGGTGQAAMAAGLAGLLLGGKRRPKKMLGSVVKMGGLALVAGLAYRAYQQHQAGQSAADVTPAQPDRIAAPAEPAFLPPDDSGAQSRSRLILRAMIAAAKADGHVDAEEQGHIFGAIDTLDLDNDDKAFLMDELRAPLDLEALARDVDGLEAAAEVYLASCIVVDEVDPQERAYLDRLAARLGLDKGLAATLEAQIA